MKYVYTNKHSWACVIHVLIKCKGLILCSSQDYFPAANLKVFVNVVRWICIRAFDLGIHCILQRAFCKEIESMYINNVFFSECVKFWTKSTLFEKKFRSALNFGPS